MSEQITKAEELENVRTGLASLISSYPFSAVCYEVARQRYGDNDEVKEIIEYFPV